MDRISEFDDDCIHLVNEVGVFDQSDAQVGIVLLPYLAQAYDISFVPGGQYPFDYDLESSFRRFAGLHDRSLVLRDSVILIILRERPGECRCA
jgi:hypothetical protein